MVDYSKAVELVEDRNPGLVVSDSLDMGSFWIFSMRPKTDKDNQGYLVGHVFDAVRKTTGELFSYDILTDPQAFLKAKRMG